MLCAHVKVYFIFKVLFMPQGKGKAGNEPPNSTRLTTPKHFGKENADNY
jgi:hypothetical protein